MMTRNIDISYESGTVTGVFDGEPVAFGGLLAHGAGGAQAHPWIATIRGAPRAQAWPATWSTYRETETARTRARLVQHIWIGRKAGDPLHVKRSGCAAHQFWVVVHHGDVVVFAGKMTGDLPADLTRAADDDFHAWFPAWPA